MRMHLESDETYPLIALSAHGEASGAWSLLTDVVLQVCFKQSELSGRTDAVLCPLSAKRKRRH